MTVIVSSQELCRSREIVPPNRFIVLVRMHRR
ncbi:MAG: hypothetical protein BWX48_01027 [Verrucomicrobia bacterium ADurb.Bin006]|nr:MAG: hypothetical protein BWX48_01027 [Verrucomicrobia bacterium ADurb.Bin006]